MNENTSPTLIPGQTDGAKTDIIESVECATESEAATLFTQAKARLLDINNWEKLCGTVTANFQLTDATGKETAAPPEAGNYFKIDIPGPGSITGEGYDWVKIEVVEEDQKDPLYDEIIAIKVRPASNPENDKKDVAHFFTDEATSSFIVQRAGNKVTAEIHGRNEKPNTQADAVIDKTRNAMIASGAMIVFSEVQWKSLAKGLLGK